jgi:hypothetical protein
MNATALKPAVSVDNPPDEAIQEPINALVLVQTATPLAVFSENGLDPLIERIENHARTIALDISTDKGRKQIRSLAHNIAQSKTALDDMGKKLVAGWKEQAKKVDLERARAWDRLDNLQKEIRQPLTEWEDREKNRIAAHEANLAEIAQAGSYTAVNWQTLPLQTMQDRLAELQRDKIDWQEFSARAKLATETAISTITAAIVKRQKHDAEQAELARLRKEEEERKQREHEEYIARAAAEQARLLAEEEARKVAEAEAARVRAEQEKAERERQRIQREKEAAEARARRAEQEKKDAEARAERDRIAAEEKAKRQKAEAEARAAKAEQDRIAVEARAKEDARIAAEKAAADKKVAEEAAAKRERDRIEGEKKAEANAAAKREADTKHREHVNGEAVTALSRELWHLSEEDCFRVVKAIAAGNIPHIKISY